MIIQPTHDFHCPQFHALDTRLEFLAFDDLESLRHLPAGECAQAYIGDALCLGEEVLGGLHLAEWCHGLVFVKEISRP